MAVSSIPYNSSAVELLVLSFTAIGLAGNFISIVYKFTREFTIPKLWKYALLTIDFAYLLLGVGLLLFYVYLKTSVDTVCSVTGFFIQFGIFDCVCGYLTVGILILGIYNPGKSSHISSFHRNVFLVIVVPQKIISVVLSVLPTVPIEYFTASSSQVVECYKISKPGEQGDKFGILLWIVIWTTISVSILTVIIGALKNCKNYNNRISSTSPNVWQAQLLTQGKYVQRFLLIEETVVIIVLGVVSGVVYSDTPAGTWIVYITLGVSTVVHFLLTLIQSIMFTLCCCRRSTAVDETHRKLKRLDLIRIDAPGKICLRALWNVSKGSVKRGLMKVYGPNHLKAWAQEIVVLGTLRKIQHPSLLQCLWTSSSNPYYETMTLITGEVITSDSRIICLELTNSGTLQDFLYNMDTPLPETCQRMVVHDIAEGLAQLHSQGILHSNLNTACVYLKGSLPNMVMRAAIGDFEDSQTYGSLHQNIESDAISDKRHFFLPDIRSFALVALEIVSKMCEKRFLSMQYEWDIGQGMEPRYPESNATPVMNDVMMDRYDSDSDYEEDRLYRRGKRLPKGLRSPAEVIQEIGRRSRSISPGSRPMSAQSNKSRSRTLSPELLRKRSQSPGNSLFPSRSGTPDTDAIRPEDEYPDEAYMASPRRPLSPAQRPMTPDRPHSSDGRKTPRGKSPARSECDKANRPQTPKKLSKQTDSNGPAFEAFRKKSKSKGVMKIDSKKWLAKPSSFIKTLTGSETSVSAFKAKDTQRNDSAEEISDEEIERTTRDRIQQIRKARRDSMNSDNCDNERTLHRTDSKHSDQWSIRSDMEYRPHGLRNTISADSRSSMWSNLPLPLEGIDIEGGGERDEFEEMIGCLPGMTNPHDSYRNAPSLQEMLEARETLGVEKRSGNFRYDGPGPSQFELVDYYDELQGKFVKRLAPKGFHRTMSGSQLLSKPVHRTYSGTQILHKTNSGLHEILEQAESMDEDEEQVDETDMCHKESNPHQPVKKLKAKLLKEQKPDIEKLRSKSLEREDESKSEKQKTTKRKGRSKSLRANSNSKGLGHAEPVIVINPDESAHKRARARKALKNALGTKGQAPIPVLPLKIEKKANQKQDLTVKYASVKKLQTRSNSGSDLDISVTAEVHHIATTNDSQEQMAIEYPQKDQQQYYQLNDTNFPRPKSGDTNLTRMPIDVKRFHSFSSNDSSSSISSGIRVRRADVSLTSGELTSLSSQADPDTDEQTDLDLPLKVALLRKTMQHKAKFVDSGFDSESSELSSDVHVQGHGQHQFNCVSSDDYAYPDNRDRFAPKKRAPSIPEVSVDSTNSVIEKAFVLTGFSSEHFNNSKEHFIQKPSSNGQFSPELEMEYLPEADTPQYYNDENVRPSSSLSRIIQVSSAPIKNDFPESKEAFSVQPSRINTPPSPPKTPVKVNQGRPKTPSAPQKSESRHVTEIRGPNVYASPMMASKRYRELTQKGVPLRVSVISADSGEGLSKKTNKDPLSESKIDKNSPEFNMTDDQKLFDQLESTGFFHQKRERPKSAGVYSTGLQSRRDKHLRGRNKKRVNRMPLDEIIREIPEEKTPSPRHKSPGHNPFVDDSFLSAPVEEAMLNQPSSSAEDGDTGSSVLALPRHSPIPPRSVSPMSSNQTSVVVDAELYIDRIYSQNQGNEPKNRPLHLIDPDFDMPVRLDSQGMPILNSPLGKGLSHELNEDPRHEEENEGMSVEVPLLNGVDDKHVKSCQKITCEMHLVSFNDLLPAKKRSFEMMKTKLQQGGQLGNIGTQLLDVIQTCWLNEFPPSSADLVIQLIDPVTETEL